MDTRTTIENEPNIVGWKDNKSVYVLSNCNSREPISIVQQSQNYF